MLTEVEDGGERDELLGDSAAHVGRDGRGAAVRLANVLVAEAAGFGDADLGRGAGHEGVVAEDDLGDAVAEAGVGFVGLLLGLASAVQEDDQGPLFFWLRHVIWGHGDEEVIAIGGGGCGLLGEDEGDVACPGIFMASVLDPQKRCRQGS